MNTFGNDNREVPPQSQRAVAGRNERQPTIGELVHIVKDLLPEKWETTAHAAKSGFAA
jgi:hypothetical protein